MAGRSAVNAQLPLTYLPSCVLCVLCADPASKLAYRSFALGKERLDGGLVASRLAKAAALRQLLFDPAATSGFR